MSDIQDKNSKIEETLNALKWIRIIDPVHIPKDLVEQIKDRDYTVEKFYKYQKSICVEVVDGAIKVNPFNLLFVIADKDNKVRGFFWGVIDALGNYLCINTFSIDSNLWFKGLALKMLREKCLEIKEGANLSKVYWVTRCPKHSEKHGFRRSKSILMEYTGEDYGQDNDGVGCKAGGESPADGSTNDGISK